MINKTAGPIATPVTLKQGTSGVAQMFSYSGADLTAFHTLPPVGLTSGGATVELPASSMNMLVLPLP